MVSFTSPLRPMSMYTGDSENSSGSWRKSSVTRTPFSGRFFQNARIPRLEGLNLTIRQLIQQQRQRLCSTNPVERFAAALLISGELTKRLSKLNDCEIGELLDDEVGARLNLFAPELTICLAAVDRLRGRANGKDKLNPAQSMSQRPREDSSE